MSLSKLARLMYLSVSDIRDRDCEADPSPSPRSSLTHTMVDRDGADGGAAPFLPARARDEMLYERFLAIEAWGF